MKTKPFILDLLWMQEYVSQSVFVFNNFFIFSHFIECFNMSFYTQLVFVLNILKDSYIVRNHILLFWLFRLRKDFCTFFLFFLFDHLLFSFWLHYYIILLLSYQCYYRFIIITIIILSFHCYWHHFITILLLLITFYYHIIKII